MGLSLCILLLVRYLGWKSEGDEWLLMSPGIALLVGGASRLSSPNKDISSTSTAFQIMIKRRGATACFLYLNDSTVVLDAAGVSPL